MAVMEVNKIIVGDCLEVTQDWPDNCVDLVFTSPPYNLGNVKKNSFYACAKNKEITIFYDNHNDNMPTAEYVGWQQKIIRELVRVTKTTGAIFYNHKPRTWNGIYDDRKNLIPCNIRQEIVWDRCGGVNFAGTFFLPTTERIFIIAGKDWKPNKEYLGWGEVWRIAPETNSPHPAPFPLALAKRVVLSSSKKDDLIYDCYSGSGTTCVAAKKLGRRYIGIDISEKYCEIARMRLKAVETGVSVAEQLQGQKGLFE